MNGPNINKSLWEKVNQKMVILGFNGLLSLLMCNLHIVYKILVAIIKRFIKND